MCILRVCLHRLNARAWYSHVFIKYYLGHKGRRLVYGLNADMRVWATKNYSLREAFGYRSRSALFRNASLHPLKTINNAFDASEASKQPPRMLMLQTGWIDIIILSFLFRDCQH